MPWRPCINLCVTNPIAKQTVSCGNAHVCMASHLDGIDNHAVRLNHFLNNKLIHVVRPGYCAYCDVSTFAVFVHQATNNVVVCLCSTASPRHRLFLHSNKGTPMLCISFSRL